MILDDVACQRRLNFIDELIAALVTIVSWLLKKLFGYQPIAASGQHEPPQTDTAYEAEIVPEMRL